MQGALAFVYKKLYDLRSSALDKEQKKIEQAKKEGKKIEYMVDPVTKKTIPIIMEKTLKKPWNLQLQLPL